MKLAKEVEGVNTGVYTLFLDALEARTFFEFSSLKKRAYPEGSADSVEQVKHIYVSDTHNLLSPKADCLRVWNDLNLMVTIEVSVLVYDRKEYPSNVTFMFNLSNNQSNHANVFFLLKEVDQIKFHRETLDGPEVVCFVKGTGVYTAPSAFKDDIEFTARTDDHFRI